jgi:hypothetical protein
MNPSTPIAVVGMAGLFPGASDLDIFWHNIVNKVSASVDAGEDRWSVNPEKPIQSVAALYKISILIRPALTLIQS